MLSSGFPREFSLYNWRSLPGQNNRRREKAGHGRRGVEAVASPSGHLLEEESGEKGNEGGLRTAKKGEEPACP